MPKVSMTGNDTLKINNRIFSDFADGDVANLEFPNDIASVKTGKNGNSIYALNTTGQQADFTIRTIRGSDDDKFLNQLISQQNSNFAGFPLMQGEFTKRIGDGLGTVTNDTYILGGGIFTKFVAAKSNVEGDTEQSISMYHMKFSNAPRVIG